MYKEMDKSLESGMSARDIRNGDALIQIWNIGTKIVDELDNFYTGRMRIPMI